MKRTSTSDPLTADDIAERLERAIDRVIRILMDVRQIEGLRDDVRRSRYLVGGSIERLAAEVAAFREGESSDGVIHLDSVGRVQAASTGVHLDITDRAGAAGHSSSPHQRTAQTAST